MSVRLFSHATIKWNVCMWFWRKRLKNFLGSYAIILMYVNTLTHGFFDCWVPKMKVHNLNEVSCKSTILGTNICRLRSCCYVIIKYTSCPYTILTKAIYTCTFNEVAHVNLFHHFTTVQTKIVIRVSLHIHM